MATNNREERMASRLRGAQRHQVEDVSFGFVLPAPEEPSAVDSIADTPAPTRSTPNTSAKRRRVDPGPDRAGGIQVQSQAASAGKTTRSATRRAVANPTTEQSASSAVAGRRRQADIYEIPDHTSDEAISVRRRHDASPRSTTTATTAAGIRRPSSLRRSVVAGTAAADGGGEDELESLPRPTPPPRATARPSAASARVVTEEVVGESPADAPGSGQRRRVVVHATGDGLAASSAALQRIVGVPQREHADGEDDDDNGDVIGAAAEASSPLTRKSRAAAATGGGSGRRRTRVGALRVEEAAGDDVDELSPTASGTSLRRARLSAASALRDEVDELSPAVPMRRSGRGSAVKARQEVDELSPDKPGESEAVPSSARSRRAAGTGVAGAKRVRSSPADKAKALPKQPGKRGRKKSSAREEKEEIDELSPEKADAAGSGPKDRLRRSRRSVGEPGESAATTSRSRRGRRSSARETELAEEESEEAEEIDEQEAARRLARKRPRRSLRDEASPELDSRVAEDEPTGRKRRKKDVVKSPAAQKQPQPRQRKGTAATHGGNAPAVTTKRRSTKAPTGQTATRGKRKAREADELQDDAGGDDDGGGRDGSVAVTVQRFTKRVLYDTTGAAAAAAADGDDNSGADVLAADIPFAKRGGPNAVDVLAQACEDLLEGFLGNLQERARSARRDAAEAGEAGDAVGKKRREIRVMMRALEEFREELRTRLLEHTIALDTVHALGKRIRATQKEKLSLREDILRIRAEREQVALRMDALRIKHEEDREKALQNNRISSAMHDVDLAVERGVAAPPLPAAEARTAELPNLELLIRSVADQACSRSDGGGLLKQVKDFNAFLERAAAALEGR